MYTKLIFTVFGGDKRQLTVARLLSDKGHAVRLWGVDSESDLAHGCDLFLDWRQAVSGSDAIILPLPASRDGITLATTIENINLTEIIDYAIKVECKHILGGLIPDSVMQLNTNEVIIEDYYKSETLQKKNALPSAEGALMIAMEQTDITVFGMNALVCGYGRIGKCLADILSKLGAQVTVAARRNESLNEASALNFETIRLNSGITPCDMSDKRFDVIFNTIPYQIFTNGSIKTAKCKPLYVEIASAPFGIDISAAREAGIEVIFAPSIPAKYAPKTAGVYIFETINEIMRNRGIYI